MILDDAALDTLFRTARTYSSWADTPVTDERLRTIYDLAALGPTSANASPARFVFCRTVEARETLAGCVSAGNAAKVRAAPVTVIIGMDLDFHEKLPQLFPHADARSWFVGKPDLIRETAFRNSSLQGAYLMLAARTLGLDCGPMSGFDKAAVDAAFFADTSVETNFICSLGYGTTDALFPRSPRLTFDEAATLR
jgi:3-hydroxypropanoate dehydrogenase